MSDTPDELAEALVAVTVSLPGGGEERPGQLAMAKAVARAVSLGRHLVVQAGTGTGKSLAYLLPVVLSGRKAVVATATTARRQRSAGRSPGHFAQGFVRFSSWLPQASPWTGGVERADDRWPGDLSETDLYACQDPSGPN